MASSLLVPLQQILASNGDLGASLQLFVYQTGTTTKLNTYPTAADADAATNANSNPLVLNARGEVPALFVPDSVLTCKLVLAPVGDTDPPASALTTRDGIYTVPKAKLHDYAATTAAASTDDAGDGYSVGSEIIDTTNDQFYKCVDPTADNAVWQLIPDVASGTWTAAVVGSSTAGTYEIASQISTYYRIGKMYFVSTAITMAGSLSGGGTGNLQVTGLPATKKANMAARGSVDLSNVNFTDDSAYLVARFASDSSASAVIEFHEVKDNGDNASLGITGIAANDVIAFSIAYEVA